MNWKTLVKLEPRLLAVERFARSARRNGLTWIDFALRINQLLRPLLGAQAAESELRSDRAGRVARKHLMSVRVAGQKDGHQADRWDGDRMPWDMDDEREATDTDETEMNYANTKAVK